MKKSVIAVMIGALITLAAAAEVLMIVNPNTVNATGVIEQSALESIFGTANYVKIAFPRANIPAEEDTVVFFKGAPPFVIDREVSTANEIINQARSDGKMLAISRNNTPHVYITNLLISSVR